MIWPFLLIVVGVIGTIFTFATHNADIKAPELVRRLLDLWPLVFVFAGVVLIINRHRAKR